MWHCKNIFHIYCEHMYNYYIARANFLGVNVAMKVLVKLLYLYKSDSYDDIYLSLHCFFDSLRLIYNYNFLTFIQSDNIYSWHNKRWNYASPMQSGCHFLGVYTSNPFVDNLISVSKYTHFSQKITCRTTEILVLQI